jgi:putative glutamine amidotransferase
MKPLIGITCNYSQQDLGTATGIGVPGQHWTLLATDYVRSVEKAGGIPMLLPFPDDIRTLFELVERCDGVLITGGDDVAPFLYGEDVSHLSAHLEPVRDRQEDLLLRMLLDHSSVPLLGVCRGCQILNVAGGGTLYQDLPSQGKHHTLLNASRDSFAHRVRIEKGSLLEKIIGSDSILTNSYHHQAVKEVAPGFQATGTAADGVIEAVEKEGDRFVLGVQWHPEMTYSCEINQRIFRSFVQACE